MKVECSGCKKLFSEDEFDSCYSVYKCRKDHIFINCCGDCHRVFEKKCGKIFATAIKQQHKLNNDGHTSALRRLPPTEREKFKQLNEAQQWGLMICPEEVKASDRSIPHCAHILSRSGGTAQPDGVIEQEAPPPPPPRQVAAEPTGPKELLGDDMLVALHKDEEDADELVMGKKKKGVKNKRDKKGTPISLDIDYNFGTRPGETGEEEWADASPLTAKPLQAFPVSSPVHDKPQLQKTPTAQGQKIKTLSSMLACSDEEASSLLKSNNWDLSRATDAYFRQLGEDETHAQAASAEVPKRWGPKTTAAEVSVGGAKAAEAKPTEQARSGEAEPEPQPRPAGPEAPRLPEGWKAIWCKEQQAFYFWHTPTNQTQWDPPDPPVDPAEAEAAAQAARARAEAQARAAEQAQARLELAAKQKAEREAAERAAAEEERAAAERAAAEREAAERAAAERAAAARAAAEEAERAARRQEEEQRLCAQVHEHTGVDLATARSLLEHNDWNLPRALRAHVGDQPPKREEAAGQNFTCSRHWRPKAEFAGCIRLLHGDCVCVTWTDGKAEGWAFGRVLDDQSREGYFPRAVIRELKHRELRPRALGERLSVLERFDTPEAVGGYVFVQPGDTLRLLYPMEEPYVWAYVEREGLPGVSERGWVPTIVIGEPKPKEVAGGAFYSDGYRGIEFGRPNPQSPC